MSGLWCWLVLLVLAMAVLSLRDEQQAAAWYCPAAIVCVLVVLSSSTPQDVAYLCKLSSVQHVDCWCSSMAWSWCDYVCGHLHVACCWDCLPVTRCPPPPDPLFRLGVQQVWGLS